jgi:DNA-binding MarR family transcriptional regulator
VTNVSDRREGVKAASSAGEAGRPAAPGASSAAELDGRDAELDAERDALEISRLLVEVLQVGHVGRRGGHDPEAAAAAIRGSLGVGQAGRAATPGPAGAPGGGSPLSSHVIRAAIYIYAHGPQTVGQLASGLGVSQGWASRVVSDLEVAGYLERQRDPVDRRVVRVSLTPKAVERVERAYQWRGDAVEAALEGMTDPERTAVAEFLRRFVEAARAEG